MTQTRTSTDENVSLAPSSASSSASSASKKAHMMNGKVDYKTSVGGIFDNNNDINCSVCSSTNSMNQNKRGQDVADHMYAPSSVLVQNETKWLSKARLLMMFVLVVGMAASATATYIFTTRLEESDFKVRVSKRDSL
jgi:hypothetical protein